MLALQVLRRPKSLALLDHDLFSLLISLLITIKLILLCVTITFCKCGFPYFFFLLGFLVHLYHCSKVLWLLVSRMAVIILQWSLWWIVFCLWFLIIVSTTSPLWIPIVNFKLRASSPVLDIFIFNRFSIEPGLPMYFHLLFDCWVYVVIYWFD